LKHQHNQRQMKKLYFKIKTSVFRACWKPNRPEEWQEWCRQLRGWNVPKNVLIILRNNYRLVLPVGSFIILTWASQPTSHTSYGKDAGRDKEYLSDEIRCLLLLREITAVIKNKRQFSSLRHAETEVLKILESAGP